jgi:hypothetical protein
MAIAANTAANLVIVYSFMGGALRAAAMFT